METCRLVSKLLIDERKIQLYSTVHRGVDKLAICVGSKECILRVVVTECTSHGVRVLTQQLRRLQHQQPAPLTVIRTRASPARGTRNGKTVSLSPTDNRSKGVVRGWPKPPPISSKKKNYKAKTTYSIYNIQPHRRYVATLPEIPRFDKKVRYVVFFCVVGYENVMDEATN